MAGCTWPCVNLKCWKATFQVFGFQCAPEHVLLCAFKLVSFVKSIIHVSDSVTLNSSKPLLSYWTFCAFWKLDPVLSNPCSKNKKSHFVLSKKWTRLRIHLGVNLKCIISDSFPKSPFQNVCFTFHNLIWKVMHSSSYF